LDTPSPEESELKTLKIRIYPTLSEDAILCRWMDRLKQTAYYVERNPNVQWLLDTPRETRSYAIRQYKFAYKTQLVKENASQHIITSQPVPGVKIPSSSPEID
ncbi:12918_t:CDS:2, partial [Racocetra persica]